MTYRDRRAARAERLRGWADKRDAKATAAFTAVDRIADNIPLGQPILVGHHSERRARRDAERIRNGMTAGFESLDKARSMRSRADNIEAAAEVAIYSDDPDAVVRLREKIAALTAERDMVAAYNASARKAAKTGGTGDLSLLTPEWVANLARLAKYTPYNVRPGNGFPSYATGNISGNLSKLRARLAHLERTTTATHGWPGEAHEGHGCPDDPTWDPDRKEFTT